MKREEERVKYERKQSFYQKKSKNKRGNIFFTKKEMTQLHWDKQKRDMT